MKMFRKFHYLESLQTAIALSQCFLSEITWFSWTLWYDEPFCSAFAILTKAQRKSGG